MPIKSIAVFLDEAATSDGRLLYALKLAIDHKAHVTGLFTLRSRPDSSYARGDTAINEYIAKQRAAEHQIFEEATRRFNRLAEGITGNFDLKVVREHDTDKQTLHNTLFADLVIVGEPASNGLPESWSAEDLLLASGVPLLVVPRGWEERGQFTTGQTIVVGWNGSRQARRAIAAALPLMTIARSISLVMVDTDESCGDEPGSDIARYLSRHGIKVHVALLRSNGASVSSVILEEARRVKADMLVLGAYSHNRTIETLFGGVTHDLFHHAGMPLFIAH
ncbi:universal stress protein [Agrobacterium sp. MOPV5]|uniref:universal stress protein n=1 Tax=Agrobacterium leguminum TaxID=2792015 RepID=UPI0018C1D42F|nr:universal stress protein [Agrobacterium leguminum]MBG0511638.1 universal stress protein [Agrobacterium leguminum]